jgi:hypothetical protein
MPLSPDFDELNKGVIEELSAHIWGEGEEGRLLSAEDRYWSWPNLQRLGMEHVNEMAWREVLAYLGQDHKRVFHFLENGGAAARAWLECTPTDPSCTLADGEVKLALQSLFLSPHAGASPEGRCRCAKEWTPTHYLVCQYAGAVRTTRHTHIRKALASFIRRTGQEAGEEVFSGHRTVNGDATAVISDITTSFGGTRYVIDFAVTSTCVAHAKTLTNYHPTDQDVDAASAKDEQAVAAASQDKSRRKSLPHPGRHVRRLTKCRELVVEKSLGKIVGWMCEKKKHYAGAGVSVVPFVMTAQGYLSREASDFIGLTCSHVEGDEADKHWFRGRVLGRISVLLIRFAYRMFVRELSYSMTTR